MVVAQTPEVGIITRTRDRNLFLKRALQAVAGQIYQDWHLIVVNDGGAQKPLDDLVDAFVTANPDIRERITVLHCDINIGRSAAFNKGLKALQTEFITCLDDDDTWAPEFLSELVTFYREISSDIAGLAGVASKITAIKEHIVKGNGDTKIEILGEDHLPWSFRRPELLLNRIAYVSFRQDMLPVQWLIRRDVAVENGGFPEDFDVMEDRMLILRILRDRQIAFLNKNLAFHHRRITRSEDSSRDIDQNTIDNPSYDWSLFSAKSDVVDKRHHEAPPELSDVLHELQDVAATVVRELNQETSALWHQIDAVQSKLNSRENTDLDARDDSDIAFDLWREFPQTYLGYAVARGTPFMDRFELSQNFDRDGNMIFLDPGQQQFILQLPECREWSALECRLDDLIDPERGLRVEFVLTTDIGYLFQSGLSVWAINEADEAYHTFEETHVHSAASETACVIRREFSPEFLNPRHSYKFSIIAPKLATNFRLCCREFRVSHI